MKQRLQMGQGRSGSVDDRGVTPGGSPDLSGGPVLQVSCTRHDVALPCDVRLLGGDTEGQVVKWAVRVWIG